MEDPEDALAGPLAGWLVADVAAQILDRRPRAALPHLEVVEVGGGLGEIEDADGVAPADEGRGDVGADEPGSTGDEVEGHERMLSDGEERLVSKSPTPPDPGGARAKKKERRAFARRSCQEGLQLPESSRPLRREGCPEEMRTREQEGCLVGPSLLS